MRPEKPGPEKYKPKDGGTTAAIVAAALVGACSTQLDEAAVRSLRITQSRDARERSLQQTWVGRSRQDLVKVFGRPAMVLGVPGSRLPESIILVYRGTDPAGNCIDAFVVLTDDAETIWNYFCR